MLGYYTKLLSVTVRATLRGLRFRRNLASKFGDSRPKQFEMVRWTGNSPFLTGRKLKKEYCMNISMTALLVKVNNLNITYRKLGRSKTNLTR